MLALFHGRVIAEFGSGWSDRDLVSAMEGLPTGGGKETQGPPAGGAGTAEGLLQGGDEGAEQ